MPRVLQVELREIPLRGGARNSPEIPTGEAYLGVRRNKPAPCLTRGRMRATQQMDVFQQPVNIEIWGYLLDSPCVNSLWFMGL